MRDWVALGCLACGRQLQIGTKVERFACAECGTEQIVRRGGGAVWLVRASIGAGRPRAGVEEPCREPAPAGHGDEARLPGAGWLAAERSRFAARWQSWRAADDRRRRAAVAQGWRAAFAPLLLAALLLLLSLFWGLSAGAPASYFIGLLGAGGAVACIAWGLKEKEAAARDRRL